MAYTIQQIIDIGKVSQYLCANEIQKKGLFGGGIDLQLPRKLYCIRKNVEYIYTLAPSTASLTQTSNYLLALCAPFSLQAAFILGGGNNGSVSPTGTDGYRYVSIPFTIAADASSFNDLRLVGGKDMSLIILDNQPLTEGKDFTYDSTTGTVNFITVQLFTGSTITFFFQEKY